MSGTIRGSLVAVAVAALGLGAYACTDDTTTVPSGADAGAVRNGGLRITVSGEDLAVNGYEFGPSSKANDDPIGFVDGWDLRFEHVIVTIDKIRLNADPDQDEANPEAMGAVVASLDGPWAVDTSIGGPITGKSGSPIEKTVEIGTINALADGAQFDSTARYGFSYDITAASPVARLVNLDDAGKALYEEAKVKGWAMIFAGTATYKGAAPAAGSVFEKIPAEVKFTLGMANPSSYINCQNTDLTQLPSSEFPRGIQTSADRITTAQITIHTDHAFWSQLNVEGTELHFDPIAAQSSSYGTGAASGVVTMDDLVAVDVTGFKTRAGEQLPGRSLLSDFTAPSGQLAFDANGTSFAKANSYAAYLAYSASAGGHLNADGECTIKNHFTP